MEPLKPLFGLRAKMLKWVPYLCASSPVTNRFVKFTSGVTPADLCLIHVLVHVQALVGMNLESNVWHSVCSNHLSHSNSARTRYL